MILHVYIEKLFEYSEGNHKGNFNIKLARTYVHCDCRFQVFGYLNETQFLGINNFHEKSKVITRRSKGTMK